MAVPPSARARALVDEALQRPPHSRLHFIRAACGSDEHLLVETSELLNLDAQGAIDSKHVDVSTTIESPKADEHRVVRGRPATEFRGTDRFTLRRRLGSGGFGVVYEAHDHARDVAVALKLLRNVTSDTLYRFKREFRLLADVHHQNLVQLHELFSYDGHWFFTMELVNGPDFLSYVSAAQAPSETRPTAPSAALPTALERLVPALRQLVEGLGALHRAGHIHRDVKPPNVLVAPDGRVVLLDFGLLLDVYDEGGLQTLTIAGTPLYMSPEQAAGLPLTLASDWYSVGIMLYQALSGTLPFQGNYLEVLNDKQHVDPPPPSTRVEGVPPHLDALCRDLLDREASKRPSEEQILDRLAGPHRVVGANPPPPRPSPLGRLFVGRQSARRSLLHGFQQTLDGNSTVAVVAGPSGIGKTALVHAVLADIRQNVPGAVILSGRCYQRESVPYKALDSIVDALARYLRRLPALEAQAVLPRDVGSIAQLFPVMADLYERVPHRVAVPADVHEVRRRAWAGLRETFGRVGDRQPLVIFVDDLQWGDSDSAALLAELLRPPDAPVLLFVGTHRDVELETSAFLSLFHREVLRASDTTPILRLEALSVTEAGELAAGLLPPSLATEAMISLIATESGGSPFFVNELVRFAEVAGSLVDEAEPQPRPGGDPREATLAHMIVIRLSRLPEVAQHLLRLVTLNARPIPEHVLKTAANRSDVDMALSVLRAEHFLRARDTNSGIELEAYHDRIREVVVATLAADVVREHHGRLAAAWEAEPTADAELIAEHWLGAGDAGRAARFTKLAAEQADRALAFDRAARLYQHALDLTDPADRERGLLMMNLGRSLSNAGRGVQAAAVYLQAPASGAAQRLDLKQKAAQQYLFAGHMVDGLTLIREVLDEIGMTLPTSRWQTLLGLVAGRTALRLRGLGYREMPVEKVSSVELMKVDACWAVSAGLSIVDTMRGAVFQTRHLRLALRLGELQRIHRALCLEVGFVAATGSRGARRARRIRDLTAPLTRKVGTPYAAAMHSLMEGASDYLLGNWKAAASALAAAEGLLASDCTGVVWELDSTRFFRMWSHYQLGELKTVKSRFPVLLKDAEDRGDLYASAAINGLFAHVVYLADGNALAASTHTGEAIASWAQPGFHMPHLWGLWSETDIAIYEGRGVDAWHHVAKAWGALHRSLLLEVQMIRVFMLDLKGRAALAAACQAPSTRERDRLLRIANRAAAAMTRQGVGWAGAMALMVRAGIERARGRNDDATSLFTQAHEALVAVDMHLLAAVAHRQRGQLIGGTAGIAAVDEADQWMRDQEIRDPAALAQMFAPQ